MHINRRGFVAGSLGGIATAGLSEPLIAKASIGNAGAAGSAEAAFLEAFAGPHDREKRLAFLDDDATVIVDDIPFPIDKSRYADHLDFHAASWTKVETAMDGVKSGDYGDGAIVSAYYNERGKPKDAGFRQRAGFVTAVCSRSDNGWRAINLHFSPLLSNILDASPS